MAKKATIIANAKKYLGVPYVWGGDSYNMKDPTPKGQAKTEGGFDCSGYFYNVGKDSGMKIERQTAQGYSKLGTEVDYSKAVESDLLFFGKSRDSITHIAIYAGNGKMYESQGGKSNTKSNLGKGVVLSNVSRRKDLILVKRIADDIKTDSKKYKVSGTMYYRAGAGTSYKALGTIKSGTTVTITEVSSNNWGYVDGKGWISLNTAYTKAV